MPTNLYGLGAASILGGTVRPAVDTINVMLITAAYTPNFDTDQFVSTIRGNEVAGSGSYAANGSTIAITSTYVTAASATARANATAYSVGEMVRPAVTNGHVWRCVVAGTSAAAEPAAMTTFAGVAGQTVADGGVTWAEAGRGLARLTPPVSVAWTSASITARYAVIADFTPATDATRNLIACIDFGSNQTSTAGSWTLTFDAFGLCLMSVPS